MRRPRAEWLHGYTRYRCRALVPGGLVSRRARGVPSGFAEGCRDRPRRARGEPGARRRSLAEPSRATKRDAPSPPDRCVRRGARPQEHRQLERGFGALRSSLVALVSAGRLAVGAPRDPIRRVRSCAEPATNPRTGTNRPPCSSVVESAPARGSSEPSVRSCPWRAPCGRGPSSSAS
jgi:hypothetical protein